MTTFIHRRVSPSHARQSNMSGGPVPGIGGLTVIGLGLLVTVVNPNILWLIAFGNLAGLLLGLVMVVARRREGIGVSGNRPSRLLLDGC
jgi:hypothetical protein